MAKISRLGQYRLVREIGKGGMGTVYEAVQESLDRRVALKVLPPRVMKDTEFVERFKREAKSAARLHQHPNIVTIFDTGQDQGFYFYSMELVDGSSLQALIKEKGRLGIEESIGLMRQAIAGLAYAWEQYIIHRDIKPDNLMLNSRGVLKIADFGLAKARMETESLALTGSGSSMGTPYYMSPEQWVNARDVDHRADIYSLGATFYHLLTGKVVPLGGLARVREVQPDVPVGLAAVIERMLARDPAGRYQSAQELLLALDLSQKEPDSPPETSNAMAAKILAAKDDFLKALHRDPKKYRLDMAARLMLDAKQLHIRNTLGMEFSWMPPGVFQMGSPDGEGNDDERPRHRVTLTQGFWMGVHPVTRGQFAEFVQAEKYKTEAERGDGAYGWTGSEWKKDPKYNWRNPGFKQADDHPLVCVSWNDAQAFVKWLGAKEGLQYSLPSEAQWEYACRAGTTTPYCFGANLPENKANFNNKHNGTTSVGLFKAPNLWDLHDVHGNVWEWCLDVYEKYSGEAIDPLVDTAGGAYRVIRGGSWRNVAGSCRAANRSRDTPDYRDYDLGFRLARVPVEAS